MSRCRKMLATNAPPSVFLIRLAVGGVFLSEGVQKFSTPSCGGPGVVLILGTPLSGGGGLDHIPPV